jgi:hypothetical protein
MLLAMSVLGTAVTPPALARFLESDAERVDREALILPENYNDMASYRAPVAWERIWAAKAIGWRVSAGSLSINRFDYEEDVKLRAVKGDVPVALAYRQERREDMTDQRLERELRVEWSPLPALRVAWLADGGHAKEYGDMGGALAWVDAAGAGELELYYWDPDLYYGTKKEFDDDRIVRRTHTKGLRGAWALGALRLAGDVSHDWPLIWERQSRDYRYEYERRRYLWRADLELGAWSAYVRGEHERKREAKTWKVESVGSYGKSMRRAVDDLELGAVHSAGEQDWTVALQAVRREADYGFVEGAGLSVEDYEEPPDPKHSLLSDHGLYVTDHFPILGRAGLHFLQLGLHANRVEGDYEVKAQTAYDVRIGGSGGLLLNATWDLDQMAEAKAQLRPWGGGNLQFFIVF